MEAIVWCGWIMAVRQLCDGTVFYSSDGPWKGMHCVAEPWKPGYGGGGPCRSLNCVIAQWRRVHLDYE